MEIPPRSVSDNTNNSSKGPGEYVFNKSVQLDFYLVVVALCANTDLQALCN
jgi:hypothetical protein